MLDPTSPPDMFRNGLVAELRERPCEFDIQVQLCVDLEAGATVTVCDRGEAAAAAAGHRRG